MSTIRLLFGDAMARAIVEGRKTVTRRPVISRANGPVINDEHVRDQDGYCHATGTGPRWARELGAAMARGEA